MKFKINYIIIPLLTILVEKIGSYYTKAGIEWYNKTLTKPPLTPPNWVFSVAWNIIYACAALALVFVYNSSLDSHLKSAVLWLFFCNGVMNILWSYFFFYKRMVRASLLCNVLLYSTIVAIIILLRLHLAYVQWLLIPYFVWITFALYLNYDFWKLNRQ